MKHLLKKVVVLINKPKTQLVCRLGMVVGIFVISKSALAGDTTGDLLVGTTTQALATIDGTGRYWAYIIDGAISLAAFAKTKNPFVFASVLAVALGITVIVKMAGGT